MITFYQHSLNLQSATFSRIDHEDAMVALVYKATQPNGEQFILKICDRAKDYLREVYFLKHFDDILPVPKIIQVVQPEKNVHGAILMECLPGNLLQPQELTATLAYEIGSSLALIHLNRFPGYGDPIQEDLYGDPRIYFTSKFEEGLEECSNHLPSVLIEHCRRYFTDHVDLLLSVDGPCIVHRDFRPGNLIVDDGRLQGIIDWAGARISFAEEDFCSLEHGEWPVNLNNKNSFLDGYASIRPVPDYNHLIPLLRLNKAIAVIGCTVKRETWDKAQAPVYQFNRHYLATLFME